MAISIFDNTVCDQLVHSAPASSAIASLIARSSASSQRLSSALVDDAFEDNDTWLKSADLGIISQAKTIDHLAMTDGADWFRFSLPNAPATGSAVSISFLNGQGDLDLAVYSSSGRRLALSNGIGNTESISLAGESSTTFYVLVFGYRGAKNPNYTLNVTPGSPVPVTPADDAYEPNNSRDTAANLGAITSTSTTSNLVMADEGDWFQFQVSGSGTTSRYVGINFNHSQGDLDLEVLNASGRRVGLSNGVSNGERVSLNGLAAGTYYAHIYGYRGALNPSYQLVVDPGAVSTTTPSTPTAPTTTTPTPATPTTSTPTTSTPTSTSGSSGFDIELHATGLTATQQIIFNNAVARWEQVIVGDLPSVTYQGRVIDDLVIDVSASSIDGAGGVLGQAYADRFRSGSQLPYHGAAQFDSADLAQMESNGTLFSVVLHEIGHVLGIGTLWQSLGLLAGSGTSSPVFTGTQAVAAYNALTGRTESGVPLENTGGSGTADSHWRESIFGSEVMTGYVSSGSTLPLSRVTIASLADLGYQVNLSAADAFRLS